jgi:hypothetical protein
LKSVEFRDASLPGYERGSRGVQVSELLSEVQLRVESKGCEEKTTCAVVPRYLECGTQRDFYSSCVKIRCPETTSGDCNRLRTLVCVTVNCEVRRLTVALYYL